MQKDVPKGQNVLNHDLILKDTHSPTVTSSGVCVCVKIQPPLEWIPHL